MATLLSRKTHLRSICRSISSCANHLRSQKQPFPTSHGDSRILLNHPKPFLQSVHSLKDLHLGGGFDTYCRYMCSGSSALKQPNSDSTGSSEGNSGGEDKSDQSQQTGDQGKAVRGGPVSWLSFILLAITGGGILAYYDREKKHHIEEINNASSAVKQGPSVGTPAIGGPFNLIDHNGKAVSNKDFMGKWTVIYFGFTHCPDICPDELQKLALAVDKIKEKARIEIVPVFISVDPERDTVEQVRDYVLEFHPKLIGLTGSADEVKKAAKAFRVYYMKTEEEGSDYLVDHSIIMYLMDPNMEFVKFFGKNYDVETLTDGIVQEIKQYKKVK
ncbi:protein SCO1 homolog 1, mitochondrial [Impatiens glandulifera]|uniref:protein SCO1 homolog 1, mitochondrial n=1 Tax=Impatiens glandulifera TaxID=253017 RepID=UPI001FB0E9F0|nr:protein SCO1 homolog 1, mitochondrial [Impatiens glandulifera]